jgi:hypothetical protein
MAAGSSLLSAKASKEISSGCCDWEEEGCWEELILQI